jgi:hypothetical protein
MTGKPYQSCLIPFENEIVALRRLNPPMSYAKIAKHLYDKHQITVHRQTILEFLKVRAKGFKPCKYAWNIEPAAANQPTTEVPSVSAKPEVVLAIQEKTQEQPVTETPTTSKNLELPEVLRRPFEMKFSETYNLTRISPEEAEIANKIIEQKMWEKYHKPKQPEEKP